MIPPRPSLAIYLPSLQGGGVERMTLNLLPELRARGLEATVILDRAEGELLGQLPAWVRLVDLGAGRILAALPRLAAFLRRERPALLLAGLGHNNVAALLAHRLAGSPPTKVVVCQHNFLSSEAGLAGGLRYRALPLLYRLLLPSADAVVAVSRGVAADLARTARLDERSIDVIHNAVLTPGLAAAAAEPPDHPWLRDGDGGPRVPVFVAVGRLVEQKDYPTLLRAFARVRGHRPSRLLVLGSGPLRGGLETLAGELGIGGSVAFAGFRANPYPFIRAAAALVLASRYEGFGIVLAEALACGTPVVSTDCPAGPAEVLDGGRYGALVPVGDAAALAGAMLDVLSAPPDPTLLREGAKRFEAARVADAYAALFARVLGGG